MFCKHDKLKITPLNQRILKAAVTQLGECQTEDLEVAGSSPARGTQGGHLSVEALRRRKEEETEKKVRMVLLVRLSQIVATALMVIGFIFLLLAIYWKYYS